jgi:hypothetical protein
MIKIWKQISPEFLEFLLFFSVLPDFNIFPKFEIINSKIAVFNSFSDEFRKKSPQLLTHWISVSVTGTTGPSKSPRKRDDL